MARLLLGIDCNCFANRYPEPEEWTRVAGEELGLRYVQYSIDLCDPNYPWELQKQICDRTLAACQRYGITIKINFGGHYSHQNYLGHPIPEVRQENERWYRRMIDQTAYLGADGTGLMFAIMSVKDNADPRRRKMILDDAIAAYHRLAEYGKQKGLKYLAFEPSSVPRESCATIAETKEIMAACNDMAIPMKLCLDLGHRNFGSDNPEDRDCLAWIRHFGKDAPLLHIQQTDSHASQHRPFTPEYNAIGDIKPDEVIAAIEESGAEEMLLAFEITQKAFYPTEYQFMDNFKASVDYWRQFLREGDE